MQKVQRTRVMQEKHLYYSPFLIVGLTIVFYLGVLVPCAFMLFRAGNFLMLCIIALILFYTYPRIICFTRALVRTIQKKPAITLTSEYFIDHYYGVKIRWSNINKMSRMYYRWTFCAFDLKDPAEVYRQIKDPVIMVAVKMATYFPRSSFKTIVSIVDGRDGDVYEAIEKYRSALLNG